MSYKLQATSYKLQERAFTLVEFIVIISVFAIMAAVALFNFRSFRSSVSVSNLVYDVALEIKSAQTLGVSAPGELDVVVGDLKQVITTMFEYGGDFGFSKTFSIFREVETNALNTGNYDDGIDQIIKSSTLAGGHIDTIYTCSTGTCDEIKDTVYISFQRPDPEPIITSLSNICSGQSPVGYAHGLCEGTLRIRIVADDDPENKVQYVYVEPTGQIRVSQI